LGITIDASTDEIRKRYLQIARRLHPDSFDSASASERQKANELLSKLVNPAYKKLTAKEKDIAEYQLLLKLKGQQALQSGAPTFSSEVAQQLLTDQQWLELYKITLQDLAAQQYDSLDNSIAITGTISELNAAYLMRREGQGQTVQQNLASATAASRVGATPQSGAVNPQTTIPGDAKVTLSAFVEQYCRRAEDLIAKNQFASAIKELKDALREDDKNSRCHSLLGTVYLKQRQLTMARISFDLALKYDPSNKEALEGKKTLEKLKAQDTKSGPQATTVKAQATKSGGGLFGGLFGGRKK
jgi:curved DNA-binding protein CbpA